jgi:hypothetical protein
MTIEAQASATSPVGLAARIGWGSALLAAPDLVFRLLGDADDNRRARRILRLLGARHLLQAAAEWRFAGPARRAGVAVDSLHAASDIGFAVIDQRWRRAAAIDAAISIGFVALGATNTRSGGFEGQRPSVRFESRRRTLIADEHREWAAG